MNHPYNSNQIKICVCIWIYINMFMVSCVNMVLVVFMMVSGGDSMLVYSQLWINNMPLCVDICIMSGLQDTLWWRYHTTIVILSRRGTVWRLHPVARVKSCKKMYDKLLLYITSRGTICIKIINFHLLVSSNEPLEYHGCHLQGGNFEIQIV